MVPGLDTDCYEQQPGDWEDGLKNGMTEHEKIGLNAN